MNVQLDSDLKAVFDDIVARTPDIGPTPTPDVAIPDGPRQRRPWLAVAAATIALVGMGGILALRSTGTARRGAPAAGSLSGGTPVLLESTGLGGITTLQRGRIEGSNLYSGAVIAPDGTVFGVALGPTSPLELDAIPHSFEERIIGGLHAWSFIDGSAPDEIYRGVEIGCATLSVNTAGEARWSADVETLAGSISATGTSLTLTLPPGWSSLGAGAVSEVYHSNLSVMVGGVSHRVSMVQAVGAPVGFHLSSMETNPIDVSNGDVVRWHVASATTSGYHSLMGTNRETSFALSGEVSVEVLVAVADSLSAVSEDDWLRLTSLQATDAVRSDTAGESGAPRCALDRLEIVEP